jgi:hypothetical protein
MEKTSYHKGKKNWIKEEKVRAEGGEKRKNLCIQGENQLL